MTPKEKAEELMQKFSNRVAGQAAIKACAIICCDELILESYHNKEFWKEVRLEIATL